MIPALLNLQPMLKGVKTAIDGLPALIEASRGGMQQQLFATSGNFVVPEGVTRVYVTMCGGGGAGGHGYTVAYYNNSPGHGGRGGNGGCSVVRQVIPVTPGNTIPVIVGAGGIAADAHNSGGAYITKGGDSSFGDLVVWGGLGAPVATHSNRTEPDAPQYPEFSGNTDTGQYFASRLGGSGKQWYNPQIVNPTSDNHWQQYYRQIALANGQPFLSIPGGSNGVHHWPHGYTSDMGWCGGGGGAGLGGKGGDGGLGTSTGHSQPATSGEAAAPNTGAGGGGGGGGDNGNLTYSKGAPGGNGGSGFVLVEWSQ